MRFPKGGENPQFDFDGYRVRLASGTSIFDGETQSLDAFNEGIWPVLNEEGYHLLGNSLFDIDSAEKRSGTLSGISPKLHIELSLLNWYEIYSKNFVVLILDNEKKSLVDWALAIPVSEVSSYFELPPANATIYFDLPLVPISRNIQPEISFGERAALLDQISQWQKGTKLTFGIFSFEDNKLNAHINVFRYPYSPFLGYPLIPRPDDWMAIMGAVDFIAQKADRLLKGMTNGNEEIQVISANGTIRQADIQDIRQIKGKTLLLCHGIFSSTQDAFSGILSDAGFMAHLNNRYSKNILAWDHYTLSKTTAQNASDLLNTLGSLQNVTLDIICHSRGAGVVRNLTENPANMRKMAQQKINVEKISFVAGACLGSQLADPKNTNRLFRRLNMLFWFFGGAPTGFGRSILTIMKLLAVVAQKMPGVAAMNPTGPEIAELNNYGKTSATEYHYIRANYDIRLLPIKLVEEFLWDAGVFEGAANDLVVPYEGASASAKYLHGFHGMYDHNGPPFGTSTVAQSIVWHTNFFTQAATKAELKRIL